MEAAPLIHDETPEAARRQKAATFQNASSGVSASDLNCSDYDDDTVYTNDSCVIYDEMSCDMYCVSGSWCDFFCGDECARGGGAICALTVLSNLTKSCEKHGLCSAPAPSPSELVLDGVIEAANMAMLLLSQFEQTCAAYGCDDWVAAQVR
ncbi:hypothetical protein JL722_10024 [Aureococcus anophagefferens]|nr:hypothetical protein JL722_10024 [Aureococcus anophagefferens]